MDTITTEKFTEDVYKSGGNSGGKDIKKEKPGKKSLKGTKR